MHSITIKTDRPIVVISVQEYEGLKETIELLSANPRLPAELKEMRARMGKGEFITLPDFRKQYQVTRRNKSMFTS